MKCKYIWNTKAFVLNKKQSQGCIRLTQQCSNCYSDFLYMFALAFSDTRYFPPLELRITQKGGGEYFEDYFTFVHKADVGRIQKLNPLYITSWVKTAPATQCPCLDPG